MKKLLLIIVMFIFLGCGTSSSDSVDTNLTTDIVDPVDPVDPVVPVGDEEYVIFDNDFGFSDPDNDGSLAFALALQKQGLLKLIAISRIGYDIRNNGTIIASAQLNYWGYPNTPIGINPNSSRMRQADTVASRNFPTQNDIYNGDYQDIRQFKTDGCLNNNIGCGFRVNMIDLYKNALESSPKKVSIASGGQVINIAEALRAHPELFAEKVKMVTFLGRNTRTFLGGQDFGGNEYATWAIQYLVDNLPSHIPLIECSTDTAFDAITGYQKIPNSRIGTMFNHYHINSPVAFVYGLEHPYGVGLIEGYSIIDGIPLLYALFGETLPNGSKMSTLYGATFSNVSGGATVDRGVANGKHFIMDSTASEWSSMKDYLEYILIQGNK